jgi:hypothetical protein
MGTFIAVRAFAPPPEGVPRTVNCLEEKAAARKAGPPAPKQAHEGAAKDK